MWPASDTKHSRASSSEGSFAMQFRPPELYSLVRFGYDFPKLRLTRLGFFPGRGRNFSTLNLRIRHENTFSHPCDRRNWHIDLDGLEIRDRGALIGAKMEPSKVAQICRPRFASNRQGVRRIWVSRQVDFAFAGGASATAASVVSRRKVNVSCRYKRTAVSVWLR